MTEEHQSDATENETPNIPIKPPIESDDDIKFSNTGQRARAIIVVLIVIGAVIATLWHFNENSKKEDAIEQVRIDFQKVHTGDYETFWKTTQIDLKEIKNNEDFGIKLKEILSVSSVAYNNHIKKKALPILDKTVVNIKKLTAPKQFADEIEVVVKTLEQLQDAWKSTTKELDIYETYLDARKTIDTAGGQWLGLQQEPGNEEYKLKSIAYINTTQCIMADVILMDIENPADLATFIKNTCAKADEKADWFRRVAGECMPKLLEKNPAETEIFTATVNHYNAEFKKDGTLDNDSVFSINECLDKSRDMLEDIMSDKISKAWFDYTTAKNELLQSIDTDLKNLRK